MQKLKKYWLLAIFAIPLAYYSYAVATTSSFQRYVVNGSQIFELLSDGTMTTAGPRKFGNNSTGASVTLPTTTTGAQFSNWIPVYNVGAAVTQGQVLIASNTGTGYVQGATATTGLTTVVGVAAEAIATAANGWMIPRGGGYAVVQTTGTVNIGDLLVSTTSCAGRLTGNSAPTSGTDVGTAMSAGTAAGGTILAILH